MTYLHRRGSHLTDGDAVAHLQYVRRLYETKGKSVSLSHRYLLDSEDYPTGFHRILYRLRIPLSFLESYGGYLPILFDLCLLALIGVAIDRWGGEHTLWLFAFPLQRLWIANIGRCSHFSERAFGVLWGNIYLFFLVGSIHEENPWFLAAATAAFCLVGVSSKFGWQGTVGVSLVLSLLTLDPSYLIITTLIATASFVLTGGVSWNVLKGLVRHSTWYRSFLAPRYVGFRNHYRELFDFCKKPKLKEGVLLFLHNSVLKIVSDNPMTLLLPFVAMDGVFAPWGWSGVVLCLLIATKWLAFLGEAERYLEFTALPLFVMASTYSPSSPVGLLVASLLLGLYALHWLLLMKQQGGHEEKEKDLLALRDTMDKIKEKTILAVPLRSSFFMGLHNESNRFVTLFANVPEGERQQHYNELIPDVYPYPGSNINKYIKEYQVDYLVVDEESLGALPQGYYDFSPFEEKEKAGRYTLYATS